MKLDGKEIKNKLKEYQMTPENVNSQKPLLIWKINFSNPWNDTGGDCWYAKVFPTVSEYTFYEQTILEVAVDRQRYSQLFQSICRFYEQTIPEVTVDGQMYYQLFQTICRFYEQTIPEVAVDR